MKKYLACKIAAEVLIFLMCLSYTATAFSEEKCSASYKNLSIDLVIKDKKADVVYTIDQTWKYTCAGLKAELEVQDAHIKYSRYNIRVVGRCEPEIPEVHIDKFKPFVIYEKTDAKRKPPTISWLKFAPPDHCK